MSLDPLLELDDLPPARELRSSARAFLTVAVTLEVDTRIIRGAECQNISETGMYVVTNVRIPEGTRGVVTLTKKCADRNYTFTADFVARRQQVDSNGSFGIGVQFTRLYDDDRRNLSIIIEYHLAVSMREMIRTDEEGMEGIVFRIARTREDLAAAFRLVHDTYVHEGYMDPDPSGMRFSIHHSLPFSTTFLAEKDGEVVITTTLFLDSPIGLPADALYKVELDDLRREGRLVAEIGSFAAAAHCRNLGLKAALHIQKLLFLYTFEYLSVDDTIITIHPRHRDYYKYILLFEQIGIEKVYHRVKGSPAIAMHLNLRTIKSRLQKAYAGNALDRNLFEFIYLRKSPCLEMPDKKAPVIVWDRDLFTYFFQVKTSLAAKTDPATIVSILETYTTVKEE